MTLHWDTPPAPNPPSGHVKATIGPIVAELRTRPGEWAVVWTGGASGVALRARYLRESGCEIRSAETVAGRALYARIAA